MSANNGQLIFDDPAPVSVPVQVFGQKYILKEASAADAYAYRNAVLKSTRMDDGKITSFEGVADAEAVLVAACLHRIMNGPNGEVHPGPCVSLKEIVEWPYRFVRPIFEKAKEISGLAEEEETEEVLLAKLEKLRGKGSPKNASAPPPAASTAQESEGRQPVSATPARDPKTRTMLD